MRIYDARRFITFRGRCSVQRAVVVDTNAVTVVMVVDMHAHESSFRVVATTTVRVEFSHLFVQFNEVDRALNMVPIDSIGHAEILDNANSVLSPLIIFSFALLVFAGFCGYFDCSTCASGSSRSPHGRPCLRCRHL